MQAECAGKSSAGQRKQLQGLRSVRPDVAGMDIGSDRHWVCALTADGAGREIADFAATTPALMEMMKWLKARHVTSVAMESTGSTG